MGVCYGTPDFPTPSSTGSLKSGMKLTISSSSSSFEAGNSHDLVAACDNQAFRDGQVSAEPNLTVFSFAELKEATKNFQFNALVGEGGFDCVYKGMLQGKQQSGRTKTIIAVKTLNLHGSQGQREWLAEIKFLGRLSHPNLVKLLGFCHNNLDLALVYEFTPKGSLDNHLFGKGFTANLSWDVRLKIVVGAARGLAFLHSSERKIIHGDFKTSNILLDESFMAKLTDFGLTKSGPQRNWTQVTTWVMGTYGYAAPEYIITGSVSGSYFDAQLAHYIKQLMDFTGHPYVKSDVYSFGIILLETLTGLRAYDVNRPKAKCLLVDLARPLLSSKRKLKTIMDSRLKDNCCTDSAFQIAQLALKCIQRTHYKRPSMTEVVKELESIEAANANRIARDA